MTSEDTHLLRIKQQQIIMLKARGYDTKDEEWILNTKKSKKFIDKLTDMYGTHSNRKLLYSEYKHPNKEKDLFVMYIGSKENKKITVDSITNFVDKMTLENKDGLLVINSTLSPTANEYLNIITEHEYQIFKEEDLLYNVVDNINVSKHILMTTEEANNLKVRLGLNNKGVSFLLNTDPVCQYYNYPIGSYIKVYSYIDMNLMSQETYNYRIVVKA